MRFGTLVTTSPSRIGVQPRELATIGIHAGSDAWGVWLPNVFRLNEERPDAPEHLIISPIHPSSWPALARFDLRLQRDPEALVRALSVLVELNFNILSYDCTPSGYHHLTWTIIAEACEILRSDALLKARKYQGGAEGSRDAAFEFANGTFAPAMLLCLQSAIGRLREADQASPFLHQSFVQGTTAFGGQLYNYLKLPENVREFGEHDRIRPASVSWIQSLAFYWLYSRNVDRPLKLTYERPRTYLECSDTGEFGLERCKRWFERLPVRSMAVFDPSERVCRVLYSKQDAGGLYSIELVTDAEFREPTDNTKGLLRDVFGKFSQLGFRALQAKQTLRRATLHAETSQIAVVGASEGPAADLESKLTISLEGLKNELGPGTRVRVHKPPRVQPIAVDQLFVSTKWKWLNVERVDVRTALVKVAELHGFDADYMDNEVGATAKIAVDKISRAQAFLQIFPYPNDHDFHWLMFERGIAEGLNLVWTLCLVPELRNKLPLPHGGAIEFNSAGDVSAIREKLYDAVAGLRAELDKRRRS